MHILQPKHSKLNEKESEKLLQDLNISKSQLPKIYSNDSALPEGSNVGDIIKIERKSPTSDNSSSNDGEINIYYRVVV